MFRVMPRVVPFEAAALPPSVSLLSLKQAEQDHGQSD